jgi:hypothetical protein
MVMSDVWFADLSPAKIIRVASFVEDRMSTANEASRTGATMEQLHVKARLAASPSLLADRNRSYWIHPQ